METWMSWALFLAIAGAAYFYYNQKSPVATRGRSTTRTSATGSAKDVASWADADPNPKASKKAVKAKAPRKSVNEAVQEVGNKAEAYLSAASSTAADVEDNLPPVTTSAPVSNKTPSGKDVSDMLGSQPAAATVLNIKASDKPKATKPKVQKTEVPQETKKQRQNKKKNEEAKAAREESEKERQVLLEKQRRTAREARGEPAKNGLQAASAPTSNPWTAVPSRGAVQPPVLAPSVQLLDTFDSRPAGATAVNGTAKSADASVNLSEEEQVRLAIEDSAWTTVPKGGKKQRKPAGDEVVEESSPAMAETHTSAKPVRPVLAENKKPSSRYQILSEDFTPNTNDDSDWPVV